VIHPFHPWFGREFPFVAVQQTWKQDRVFFFDDDGTTQSVPRAWTDAADPDVFVTMAAGRSPFRVEDLLALAEVIDEIDS
jgi:Family of unknown function (DUF5372)